MPKWNARFQVSAAWRIWCDDRRGGTRAGQSGYWRSLKIIVESESMKIRKIVTATEELFSEAGDEADPPLRRVAVTAVYFNPCVGRYVEDLAVLNGRGFPCGPPHRRPRSGSDETLSNRELRQGRASRNQRLSRARRGVTHHGLWRYDAGRGRWGQGVDLPYGETRFARDLDRHPPGA